MKKAETRKITEIMIREKGNCEYALLFMRGLKEIERLRKENEILKEELRKERFECRLLKMLYEGPIEEEE